MKLVVLQTARRMVGRGAASHGGLLTVLLLSIMKATAGQGLQGVLTGPLGSVCC